MTLFDPEAAALRRALDPTLTVFDTGEMLEPIYHTHAITAAKTGLVDFEDSTGELIATVCGHPSSTDDDTIILQIDAPLFQRLKLIINDGDAIAFDVEGRAEILVEEIRQATAAVNDNPETIGSLLDLLEGHSK
jgi:hypothetical protein